ncbi:MAG: nitrile hydratase subunit alpha [Mycobacterium sp.]|jgi:nitrile hydratase|nr:nitrile hydratase subunit alpha [Mycobacterium sp.]
MTTNDEQYLALRQKAIESLLIEKGLVTAEAVDAVVDAYEHDIGPLRGAGVVARAWVDPDFKQRLLTDASAAIAELGIAGFGAEILTVVENGPNLHNVVVCTLCSCYPWALLGLPPSWYKSPEYRARVVRWPRNVLAEFGTRLSDDVEIRVWDSSSDARYMVLPQRPDGTEHLTEQELAALVTRDAMIGVRTVNAPQVAA